jgi:hypothetical protein
MSSFNDKPLHPLGWFDSRKRLSAELSNALLRLIAQHSQVESTVKPTVEPTVKTTFDIHRYTIQADCNRFDDIFIDTRFELIAINSTMMPIDIWSKPIAIAAITRIQAFIGHLAIYAG